MKNIFGHHSVDSPSNESLTCLQNHNRKRLWINMEKIFWMIQFTFQYAKEKKTYSIFKRI